MTEGIEPHIEVQESETDVVWTREETRPRILRKKDSGDGITWEKKKRKTEAEMHGWTVSTETCYDTHRNNNI